MKATKALTIGALIIAFSLTSSCEPGYDRDRDRYDSREAERSLMGIWYVNGDPNKRAEIVLTAGGLEARNEKGDPAGWPSNGVGMSGLSMGEGCQETRDETDRIDWANGTTWTRESPRP